MRKKDDLPAIDDLDDALADSLAAEPTDETPTLISKSTPEVPAPTQTHHVSSFKKNQQLSGNLRGRRLAHFELIEPIGVGGMAAVIRARDTQLERFVALKILPPEMATDVENVQRFHQEARAAAKLDHENIARVFYCGEDQTLHFIAFEFVEGENLRVILERRGRLPVGEAVRYVLQVAAGLEHAAARNVVHRDVKPSNIIITPAGRAKLVDMGLARSLERHDKDLTQSGVTLGTFDYISPEQALDPRDADCRSDIYSLGCTFYHMLTGKAPVPEGTAAKKLHHHQQVSPIDPRQLNPSIPDEIALILSRMMAKNSRDRYQRPVYLIQHLTQVAQRVGAADGLPEGGLFVDAPISDRSTTRPGFIIGMAVTALAVFLAIFLLTPGQKPQPNPPEITAQGNDVGKQHTSVVESPIPPTPKAIPIRGSLVQSASELVEAIEASKDDSPEPIKLGSNPIDLDRVVVFKGKNLKVISESEVQPTELAYSYSRNTNRPAGIVVESGDVEFRNLLFRVESVSSVFPKQMLSAVQVKGGGQVRFVRCTFVQTNVPSESGTADTGSKYSSNVSSLLVHAGSPSLKVSLEECHFYTEDADGQVDSPRGQTAIAVVGPAKVEAFNCAFHPHDTCFHVRETSNLEKTSIHLEHSSLFLVRGPAIRIDENAGARLVLRRNLFSQPGQKYDVAYWKFHPDLMFAGEKSEYTLESTGNGFHNLNDFISHRAPNYLAFKTLLEMEKSGRESSSSDLNGKTPWYYSDPQKKSGKEGRKAFQVNPEFAEFGLRNNAAEKASPEIAENVIELERKTKDGDPPSPTVTFNNLTGALSAAKKGDVLVLKPHGDLPFEVSDHSLNDKTDLTIRAHKGTHPVIVLTAGEEVKDIACFRMMQGKIVFKNLHFRLEPRKKNIPSQSVVLLGDRANCTFEGCVVTMVPPDESLAADLNGAESKQHVISFQDPSKQMMASQMGIDDRAKVTFKESYVRGDGNFVRSNAARRLDLTIQNSILVLKGSMLNLAGNGESLARELGVQLNLANSSMYVRDNPLVYLRTNKDGKRIPRTDLDPVRQSLFVAVGVRKPLVLVESNDEGMIDPEEALKWRGDSNLFIDYTSYLLGQSTDGSTKYFDLDARQWEEFQRPGSRSEVSGGGVKITTDLHEVRPQDLPRFENLTTSNQGVPASVAANLEAWFKAGSTRKTEMPTSP